MQRTLAYKFPFAIGVGVSARGRNVLMLAGLALALARPAPAGELNAVASDKSALTFEFHEMGVPVDGRFTIFEWSECEAMVYAHRVDSLLL